MIATVIVLVNFMFSVCGLVLLVQIGRQARKAQKKEKAESALAVDVNGIGKLISAAKAEDAEKVDEGISADDLAKIMKVIEGKAV